MDSNSYRFEEYNYKDVLFQNVEMTYVIHLENNGRLESVKKQLNKYKPTKSCKILYNKGFKKSHKPHLPQQNSTYDLVDAYLYILKDAQKHNYQHILILEDDFFFDKDVHECSKDVDDFIIKNKYNTYALGCIPYILYPCDITLKHHKYLLKGGTHALIYNNTFINETLNTPQNEILGWDCYTNNIGGLCYYKPLCYQLFPETENQKHWVIESENTFNNILYTPLNKYISYFIVNFGIWLLLIMNLDKSETPGYFIMYTLAIGFFYLFAFVFFYYLFKGLMRIFKKRVR